MKTSGKNCGFTLIEMLLVVAIIALLVSMMVGVAKRIDDQGKERLCRDTIELIGNALEQFRDFGYEYKGGYSGLGLTFPLDCNGFFAVDLQTALGNALAAGIIITPAEPIHDISFSGSEVLYFILSQVPDCRVTLDKVDKSLLTNKGDNGPAIEIEISIGATTTTLPFTRIVDPWGEALRYDYYEKDAGLMPLLDTKKTFPVITSAGADKQFDTKDDVSNREPK
jgi:prepilin-type N-terminal cleavage/methylation domain-containing protein